MAETYLDMFNHIESVLHIDLTEAAELLVQSFPTAFIEPEEGIYLLDNVLPSIVAGKRYYELKEENGNLKYELLIDIEKAVNNIVDEKGNIVITERQLKHKRVLLFNKPTVYSTGILFIQNYLLNEVYSRLRHGKHHQFEDRADKYLTGNRQELGLTEDVLDKILRNEVMRVEEFIHNKHWHIYWSKLDRAQMHLFQGVDWRVLEYYKLTQPEEEEELTQEGY